MPYIYLITNDINQKQYIGKTTHETIQQRWKEHIADYKRSRCEKRPLYNAMNKYGVEHFSIQEVEFVPWGQDLEEREQYWINYYDTYHNGYNATLGGDGSSYLELPEQEICDYYLVPHTLKEVCNKFGHDIDSIKKILQKNNIPIRSLSENHLIVKSYPVAKIDKNTNEIIEIYPSVHDAELANGNTHHIADVIKGTRQTCKGFKWKKLENCQMNQTSVLEPT